MNYKKECISPFTEILHYANFYPLKKTKCKRLHQVKLFATNTVSKHKTHIGTVSSPRALFSGLQRRVTTVLRPFRQDAVGCGELREKILCVIYVISLHTRTNHF